MGTDSADYRVTLRLKVKQIMYNEELNKMTKFMIFVVFVAFSPLSFADDSRILVKLPEMMQKHMLGNMRDHLQAINEILISLSNNKLDKAASIAENRLGMSSLTTHNASHMAKFMPKGMRQAGSNMH